MERETTGSENNNDMIQQRNRVAKLNVRLADPKFLDSSNGIQFCADLKSLSQDLDWEGASEFSDSISELYQTAANTCPPTLASHMFTAVLRAVERYSECVADDELTSMHVALAALCVQLHLSSPYLQLWTRVSQQYTPINGTGEYFCNCSAVYAGQKSWELAAMHAALALIQEPDATKWRTWVLYELIAFGETRELPRVVQTYEKCPIIAELLTYFNTINRATGEALQQFCEAQKSTLESMNVWSLVKRCIVSYYFKWLRQMSVSMDLVSWDLLAPTFNPVSFDELLAAGLERHFTITKGPDGSVFIKPNKPVRDNEKALRLLHETSLLTNQLSHHH